MFYVYEWFIVQTGEVIYVGKGTGNRYRVRKHNKFFNDCIKRYDCDSRIVREFESEKDAFSYEFDRINELRAVGQCVCNIYDGGFGGVTDWWSSEMREKYSKNNAMKSRRQRQRMSCDNPMKDKATAQRVNARKRVPVRIGDQDFESIKAAAEEYGVSTATINAWMINGKTSDGEKCCRKEGLAGQYKTRYVNCHGRKLSYKGVTYRSTSEAAKANGVAQTTMARWCRQGRDSSGNVCRYLDDERVVIPDVIKQKTVPVIINGKWYPSKESASRALGISSYMITQYLNGNRQNQEYICEYGNQQPSRGKADTSTTEGSETNG